MNDLKLPFVYSEVCKVHYPIHLFTFVIVGGYARPPWRTSRSINWGLIIQLGVQPPTPRQFSPCIGCTCTPRADKTFLGRNLQGKVLSAPHRNK